jgi:hypothetical protein
MGRETHKPRTSRARMTPLPIAQERWERETMLGMLAHTQGLVRKLSGDLDQLSANLDHLHIDATAIREVLKIPRPECYPDTPRRAAARRARTTPQATEPPNAPPAPSC